MNAEKIKELQLPSEAKQRPGGSVTAIFIGVLLITGVAVFFAWGRASDAVRKTRTQAVIATATPAAAASAVPATNTLAASSSTNAATPNESVLTVSGYIINRERIEISPRFMGTVTWIGVKKGDVVTNGQVVVRLDDAEYRARLHEVDGRLANARANVDRCQLDYDRIVQLNKTASESKKAEDDARIQLASAQAALKETEGSYELAKTFLDWTIIRSPINGVVLEKLVQPNELVVPQSFGGTRGPSTALIAVADPKDLQVEIDLNESDLSKVAMDQKCRVSPEAYPDKNYDGYVAEIAPEADRSKGTLQVKVQIKDPDRYLTPNLSAKVEFLRGK